MTFIKKHPEVLSTAVRWNILTFPISVIIKLHVVSPCVCHFFCPPKSSVQKKFCTEEFPYRNTSVHEWFCTETIPYGYGSVQKQFRKETVLYKFQPPKKVVAKPPQLVERSETWCDQSRQAKMKIRYLKKFVNIDKNQSCSTLHEMARKLVENDFWIL